ncbi:contact-dependent growth inhibition system immunity protein [Curtobacterium sp. VKM Ac-2922]|uniref:contact-dependent growth inhibition system immunity protein n=1 Tax=Curtobacterium sp. VKM Ac-2922 TaxID=2929475 RepID=UPI001FB339CB|nr:contact-dependent growth inhibition system immunity protein [Curtobacterium sp. VKM Ac-2922]MCJ1715743.1 contact-dependent growth inhibition system immunity protein [Curtobacterium sp. VKM Ac-2922]
MSHSVRTGTSVFTGGTDEANRIVAHALDANHLRIRAWVAEDCPKPLRIYAVPGGVTGRGMPFGTIQDLDAVRVVLTAAPDRPSGYTVLTAYPAPASITATNFAAFDDFVGAYFHQDWADAPYGAPDALEHCLAISSPDEQQALLSDVRDLDQALPDAASLGGRLVELDCNYVPEDDGLDDRTWLRQVADRLEQELAAA